MAKMKMQKVKGTSKVSTERCDRTRKIQAEKGRNSPEWFRGMDTPGSMRPQTGKKDVTRTHRERKGGRGVFDAQS